MGAIRLGKNALRWCLSCNNPILELEACPSCGIPTKEVPITPPCDSRPAFEGDLEEIRAIADRQFGPGCGELLLPRDRIAILNRCPSLDRMDEIVSDGEILASIIFDPSGSQRLILRTPASERMLPRMMSGKVVADSGALPSMSKSSNLMGPGVISADEGIRERDEITILTEEGKVFATGSARMTGEQMAQRSKGLAVKIRWRSEDNGHMGNSKSNSWETVVDANRELMERRVLQSIKFIRKIERRYDKPVAVSFSGGKDSLVTLYLAIESGLAPDILFIDTGLELDETTAEVERVASETGLRLVQESAGNAFWEGVDLFGPPGKDFRWCCKICKLGPATQLISKNYPDGVLSLIGQRRYESEQRMQKGAVWENPWTPGQIGASPIQKWTALHVWLYIFSRELKYNPWYDRGLDRIGCFLCPSSDIAELERVKRLSKKYERWEEYLRAYSEKNQLPPEWSSLALWRWKRTPPAMRHKLEEMGVEIRREPSSDYDVRPFHLRRAEGYRPCTSGGYSAEGVFHGRLDIERVANLLNIVGSVEFLKDEDLARTEKIVIFGEGAVTIKGIDHEEIDFISNIVDQITTKAMLCIGCGICAGRCSQGAIEINDHMEIDAGKCIHCGECLGPCPVLRFEKTVEF